MARPKFQFTDEMKFVISQMVEINKSLQEIVDEFQKRFGVKVSIPTISQQITELGYDKVDCRKFNSRGKEYTSKDQSKQRPLSKYKLNQIDGEESVFDFDIISKLGYGKDGKPLNFSLIKDKGNEIVDVELLISVEDVNAAISEKCKKYSLRWWNKERMRIDFGCKHRGLLEGMNKGDFRGVVNRFRYDNNNCYRFDKFDIIKEQQECWERFITAVINNLGKECVNKSNEGVNDYNIFILDNLNNDELSEVMTKAPSLIWKYTPSFLYAPVIKYCLEKADEDGRLTYLDLDENIYMCENKKDALLKMSQHISPKFDSNYSHKIDLEVVKKTLSIHPNELEMLLKTFVYTACMNEWVDRRYVPTMLGIVDSIRIETTPNVVLDGLDWFSVWDDSFSNALNKIENDFNYIIEKYHLIK